MSGDRPPSKPDIPDYAAKAAEFREREAKASNPTEAAFYAQIAQGYEILAKSFPKRD